MYIIWDLDGTLIDVRRGVHQSVDWVARKHGLAILSDQQRAQMIGISRIQEGFRVVYGLKDEDAAVCAQEFREAYSRYYLYDAELYPKILDVLASLQAQGIQQAIATNKSADHAVKICNFFHIDKFFSHIVGSDSLQTTKKDRLAICLQRTGWIRGSDMIMIGDTKSDLEAAHDAGIPFIGVNYGYGFRDVKEFANSPEQIPNLVSYKINH